MANIDMANNVPMYGNILSNHKSVKNHREKLSITVCELSEFQFNLSQRCEMLEIINFFIRFFFHCLNLTFQHPVHLHKFFSIAGYFVTSSLVFIVIRIKTLKSDCENLICYV